MTFDEYKATIKSINNQLDDIATHTANQELIGSDSPSNPEFAALIQRHAQLTKLAMKLGDCMISLIQDKP
jgi:hypothetical protein